MFVLIREGLGVRNGPHSKTTLKSGKSLNKSGDLAKYNGHAYPNF